MKENSKPVLYEKGLLDIALEATERRNQLGLLPLNKPLHINEKNSKQAQTKASYKQGKPFFSYCKMKIKLLFSKMPIHF